jgi:hypothetical protein
MGAVTRTNAVILTSYCAATAVLLMIAVSVLALAEGTQRLRLVAQLNSWFPGTLRVVGLLWLGTSVFAMIVAYRLRARLLAVAVAGSYVVTTALIYSWASAVAFPGAGAWDVLRGVTVGGVYPMLVVFLIVGALTALTLVRGVRAPRTRIVERELP